MLKLSVSISLLILLTACGFDHSDEELDKDATTNQDSIYHLLIFKKEFKLEVWEAGIKNTFVESFQINNSSPIPIGQFDLNFDEENEIIEIIFPKDFYKKRPYQFNTGQTHVLTKEVIPKHFFKKMENAQFSAIIVFPNDNRLKGDLIPCFACPHWIAEIYSFLNIKKNEYL